jgi:hypothetical protein
VFGLLQKALGFLTDPLKPVRRIEQCLLPAEPLSGDAMMLGILLGAFASVITGGNPHGGSTPTESGWDAANLAEDLHQLLGGHQYCFQPRMSTQVSS